MMSADYWIGFATPFALAALLASLFVLWVGLGVWFERRGVTFEAKIRDTSQISDWTLRRDIWFERSCGPIFVGHWYRDYATEPLVTRWVGFGAADGPCVIIYHQREVGKA